MLIMLIMLIPGELWKVDRGGKTPQKELTLLTFPLFLSIFSKMCLKQGNVNNVKFLGPFGHGGSSIVPEELT